MPTWPAGLPQRPLSSGFSETPPENVVRTAMDAGPAKIRRRFSAGVRMFSVQYNIDDTGVGLVDTFYTTTLEGGVLSFDFPDPRSGSTISARFVGAPKFTALSGGSVFQVSMELEELP